ncbi:hypothetical protein LZ30DRAFT_699267 [Colletotrichum cereale]|nr:hypothetical protein LZ30DRAFT_699267 [Colletotrichum cereale]
MKGTSAPRTRTRQKKEGVAAGRDGEEGKPVLSYDLDVHYYQRHSSSPLASAPPCLAPWVSMGRTVVETHTERDGERDGETDRGRPSSKVASRPWHNANQHKTAISSPQPSSSWAAGSGMAPAGCERLETPETSATREWEGDGRPRRTDLCDGGFVTPLPLPPPFFLPITVVVVVIVVVLSHAFL